MCRQTHIIYLDYIKHVKKDKKDKKIKTKYINALKIE